MAKQDLIKAYQSLAALVEQMHAAAKGQDWDEVLDIELLYVEQFEQIKQLEVSHAQVASANMQQEKTDIIKNILAEEQAVRALVKPQLDGLEKKIKGTQTQVKLNNTYVN